MPVEENRPDITNDAYDAMFVYWELPLTLRGGTPAMKEARTKYLPQEKAEEQNEYDIRLELVTLFGGYDDTIIKLASRPFVKPVVLENIPSELAYLENDVDGDNTTITDFGNNLLEGMVDLGLTHVLIDFSTIEQNAEGDVATKKQEKEVGARAFFVHYSADDVIWWDLDKDGELEEIRFRETKLVDGISKKLIRIYTREKWEIWEWVESERSKAAHWSQVQTGIHTFGSIPLVSIYSNKTGRMTARPPLYNLADQNLSHWKTTADYKSALRFAMFGIIFVSGVDPKQVIGIGPGSVFKTKNTDAEMKYVEHDGHSINAGKVEIDAIEHRMEGMGLQPMVRTGGPDTATGKSIDETRSRSPLQKWARNLEEGLEACYKLAAEWHKIELLDDFQITIFKDFTLNLSGATNMKLLLESCKANKLSNETFLLELKRYGALNDTLDIDEEMNRINNEFTVTSNLLGENEEFDPKDEEGNNEE